MKSFYDIKSLVGQDGANETYVVVAEYPGIDYTLIYRNAKYEPWVAAWGYNKEKRYWSQGHYFSELTDAINYIQYKQTGVGRRRLEEIASKAISKIIQDDVDDAEEWMEYELELDDEEMQFFDIADQIEEERRNIVDRGDDDDDYDWE